MLCDSRETMFYYTVLCYVALYPAILHYDIKNMIFLTSLYLSVCYRVSCFSVVYFTRCFTLRPLLC